MVEVTVSRVEIIFGNALKIMEVPIPELGHVLLTVVFDDQFSITAEGTHVMYNLPADHTVTMQVSYVDGAGNPAKVDSVEWFTANEELATIEVDAEDPTICKVIPVAVGRTQVSARADADLGDGTRELLTVCDIMIVAGEAVAGSIQPTGEPEPMDDEGNGDHVDNTLPGGQARTR